MNRDVQMKQILRWCPNWKETEIKKSYLLWNFALLVWSIKILISEMAHFLPICTNFLCLVRFPFSVNLWSHSPHGYFLPMCTDCWCVVRLSFRVNCLPHSTHEYFLTKCTACWCLVRLLFWESWKSQLPQGYFFPWCTDWWWFVRLPFCVAR